MGPSSHDLGAELRMQLYSSMTELFHDKSNLNKILAEHRFQAHLNSVLMYKTCSFKALKPK